MIGRPNREFDFTVKEMDIVESSLAYRTRKLMTRRETVKKQTSRDNIDAEIKSIHNLLGKIHNQKNWYNPSGL
tara:strand:- start:224 stop:442 length:219 start_codon:yes stop_codon:yes gene_type:complete